MAADQPLTPAECRSRINIALSILNHREATADTCEAAVMALRGASVEDLLNSHQRQHEVA